jgi:hypothetical protein
VTALLGPWILPNLVTTILYTAKQLTLLSDAISIGVRVALIEL